MYCEKCGNKLEDDWKKCPFCGQEIDRPDTQMWEGSAGTGIGNESNLGNIFVAPERIDLNTSQNTFSSEKRKKKGIFKKVLISIAAVFAIIFIIGVINSPEEEDAKMQAPSEKAEPLEEAGEQYDAALEETAEETENQEGSMTLEEYINICTFVTGEELARNPENYVGKNIVMEGQFHILAGEIVLDWFTDSGIIKIVYDGKALDAQGNVVGDVMSGDYGVVAGRYGGEDAMGQRYIEAEVILLTDEDSKNAAADKDEKNESISQDEGENEEAPNSEMQEYIFPDSDSRYLSEEEVRNLDADGLRLARNEIFARHGYIFNDEGLSQYFNSTSWYRGTVPSGQFQADRVFNDFEKANIDLINGIEAQGSGEAGGQSWFIGKTGVYLNPLPANGTTYKINVLAIGGDTLEFEFGFLENDYVITAENAEIIDDHTAQIDFGGLVATFTWTDAEHLYVTNDHGYIGGTDSGSITDGTDGVSYEWALEFN